MANTKQVLLFILILTLLLASCGGSAASLTGGVWTVTSLQGVKPDVSITATFGTDGKISGFGGCNNYSAGYTVDGSSLTVSSPESTLMACSELADEVESDYFYLLEASGAYEIKGDKLTIKDSSGQEIIEYAAGS